MKKLSLEELHRPSASDFAAAPKLPLVFILDNIRSALNVGSIFRTADAFGVAELALCGFTARPPHRDIFKSALGSTETVAWQGFEDAVAAAKHYQALGYQLFAIEQTDRSRLLQDFSWSGGFPLALVLGNEVDGVGEGVLSRCSGAVEIPQIGTKHSLNVAVCAGIVTWHFFSQWRTAREYPPAP